MLPHLFIHALYNGACLQQSLSDGGQDGLRTWEADRKKGKEGGTKDPLGRRAQTLILSKLSARDNAYNLSYISPVHACIRTHSVM